MNIKFFAFVVAALLFCFAADSSAFAQGKGKGGGQGNSAGKSSGKSNGATTRSDNSSGKSKGKSNDAASDMDVNSHGNGKGDEQRALHAKQKANKLTDHDLNRYKGLSKKLGTTPEEMRARYQAALLRNPDLTYGNFVSAHMAADNLGGRYPNVTSDAILIGLSRGRSLGQTLQDLKVAPQHVTSTQDAITSRMRPILGN